MQKGSLASAARPFDPSVLDWALDSDSLLRCEAATNAWEKKESINQAFHILLSEANGELATLLQDVRAQSGAGQAVIPEGQPMRELLMRAVRCAVKQHLLQEELGTLALTDELTGLFNRRGFLALAERQLKLGRRSGRGILLFFADVDGLKKINDSFGHFEGDLALIRTAEVLEKTFRDSDLLARLGGDEFAMLAIEAAGHSEATITARLQESLKAMSGTESRYALSLSLGVVRFDPRSTTSIGQLMVLADQAMYEQKRRRPSFGNLRQTRERGEKDGNDSTAFGQTL